MTEDERRRYFDGRHDWREDHWEDHCGDPDCGHPGNCCVEWVDGNPMVAQRRASFAASILGAEIARLTSSIGA
jgi:hypothetical protein